MVIADSSQTVLGPFSIADLIALCGVLISLILAVAAVIQTWGLRGQLRDDKLQLTRSIQQLELDKNNLKTSIERLETEKNQLKTSIEQLDVFRGQLNVAKEQLRESKHATVRKDLLVALRRALARSTLDDTLKQNDVEFAERIDRLHLDTNLFIEAIKQLEMMDPSNYTKYQNLLEYVDGNYLTVLINFLRQISFEDRTASDEEYNSFATRRTTAYKKAAKIVSTI
jgi:hypothetical protein